MVSKVFEKLVINRIVDHLEKCCLFSDFQYGFRSSWSTADLLTVVSDIIARAFNTSRATQDHSKCDQPFGLNWLLNNLNWLLNLNLIYETLWTRLISSLLISMLGKLGWFYLTCLITLVLWMGLFLRKNHLLRCFGWPSLLKTIIAQ